MEFELTKSECWESSYCMFHPYTLRLIQMIDIFDNFENFEERCIDRRRESDILRKTDSTIFDGIWDHKRVYWDIYQYMIHLNTIHLIQKIEKKNEILRERERENVEMYGCRQRFQNSI